jgi:hypothetical protein
MSCCEDIILRMRPGLVPGAFTAELSSGELVSFDRAYLDHADPDTVDQLQAGLMPQHMIDEYQRLKSSRRSNGGPPVLTWPPRQPD